ncbi:MAG: winged helix-turn-helix transcriptional regulator [Chitinophagaceae bacterium]|nr:winged helix-turn-helix transcriptional regulator [Chitinophagaceae bacterium]MBL0337568.1 winged helix-turn-helix transcriptional regulator [Chitinophagaceae bacterium]
MGLTKSAIFTQQQNKLAGTMKALAHPARIAIIQQLLKAEHCICGELVEVLGLAQATVSQHLLELKKAGIIKGCASGTCISYCIDEKGWEKMKSSFDSIWQNPLKTNSCG